MAIFDTMQKTGLPCAYSHFGDGEDPSPPYMVYLGAGQDTFSADNTFEWTKNRYTIEYYFTRKDEESEALLEQALLEDGFRYIKGEDIYIEDEKIFVIYYDIFGR